MPNAQLLTLPDASTGPLSIRAKALLFHDPRSVRLLEHVERLARSDATALIIGETGTGKELVARHIHKTSERRGPFVAVNCGAFSETLIDAELFGHEAGSYTGATGARAGWFEAANGGTLFLDEIGDLSLALQVKLLRVLQERQVVRIGSRRPIGLDVRLVAATNIDLRRAVEAQRFRADLFYRLSVAPIALPPLRERPGDILPLAHHFLGVYSARMGQDRVRLSPSAEQALLDYVWPGNIRELENVIHFALIVCRGDEIRADDLKLVDGVRASPAADARQVEAPEPPPRAATAPPDPAHVETAPADATRQLYRTLDALLDERGPDLLQRVESALVRAAFSRCRDNQVQTAKVLGITRNALRTLLKRHGLLADPAAAYSDAAHDAAHDEALDLA